MKIVDPSYTILSPINENLILTQIETAGRTAYKSEDRITEGSASKFVDSLLARGHESVIEHVNMTVRFVCDRGVTHELVRHRLVSYTQESTRYCNYAKADEITVIRPLFWKKNSESYRIWLGAMYHAEASYISLIRDHKCTPQEARSVLPNSLKTEIVVTANMREWRHIMHLRTAKSAHPQMRELMIPLLEDLRNRLPVLFSSVGDAER